MASPTFRRKISDDEKKKLSDEARAVLDNPSLQRAILTLRQRWFAELIDHGGGDLTGARLCARIEALEAIPLELATVVNDYTVTQQKTQQRG